MTPAAVMVAALDVTSAPQGRVLCISTLVLADPVLTGDLTRELPHVM